MRRWAGVLLTVVGALGGVNANGAVLFFGDQDVLGTATSYAGDPTAGATMEGLAPDAVTFASAIQEHEFPFAPALGDFPGTDRIYVGSVQTGASDGYASSAERVNAPHLIALDYGTLLGAGEQIQTLTLGIAADDFQFPSFGQPFSSSINGVSAPALTDTLNSLNQTGPSVQFFTIGIDPGLLDPSGVLTISIDQGGTGGDGWAIDYLSVGVTTVPLPGGLALLVSAVVVLVGRKVRP